MKEFVFRKASASFLLHINDSDNINRTGINAGLSENYSYKLTQTFRRLGLVTLEPFRLTEKGKELKEKISRINYLLEHGYK